VARTRPAASLAGVSEIPRPARGIEQRLRSEPDGQLREVCVAGMHEALVHVDRAVRVRVEDIVANRTAPAGMLAPTRPSGRRTHIEVVSVRIQVLTQRGRCRHQLERGSRRIQAVARPVQQRI
jgi:hypothetical protein